MVPRSTAVKQPPKGFRGAKRGRSGNGAKALSLVWQRAGSSAGSSGHGTRAGQGRAGQGRDWGRQRQRQRQQQRWNMCVL